MAAVWTSKHLEGYSAPRVKIRFAPEEAFGSRSFIRSSPSQPLTLSTIRLGPDGQSRAGPSHFNSCINWLVNTGLENTHAVKNVLHVEQNNELKARDKVNQ